MANASSIQALQYNMSFLAPRDQAFASDLINYFNKTGRLTEKQSPWVDVLIERAQNSQQPSLVQAPEAVKLGDMAQVYSLLNKAQKLQFPSIEMMTPDGLLFRVYRAGPASKYPGHLQVVTEDNRWIGRISPEGNLIVSQKMDRESHEMKMIVLVLHFFAEHTEQAAAEFGRMTGRCAFCRSKLTDERSTAVGYGKTCAGHYGLKWGGMKAEEVK